MPNPDTKTLQAEIASTFRVFKSVEWNSEFEVRVHCAFLQDNGNFFGAKISGESSCSLEDQSKLKCSTVGFNSPGSEFPMASDLGL
jgi:hypothetical protein